jgi:hypothetical protein
VPSPARGLAVGLGRALRPKEVAAIAPTRTDAATRPTRPTVVVRFKVDAL